MMPTKTIENNRRRKIIVPIRSLLFLRNPKVQVTLNQLITIFSASLT